MTYGRKMSDGEGTEEVMVELGGRLDLDGAPDLRNRLGAVVRHKNTVAIDARNTTQIDTASVQLLLAFVKSRVAGDLRTRWLGPSQELDAVFSRLGLATALGVEPSAHRETK